MTQHTALLRSVTQEKFAEMLGASGRQAREVFFHRHHVQPPKLKLPKAGAKNEYRVKKLFEVLHATDDDAMAEEILRAYLLTRRPLLAAALDHLGIPHREGLTDSDEVDRFTKLKGAELKGLVKALLGVAQTDDVRLYLTFMGVKDVADALA